MAEYSVERSDFAGYDAYLLRAGATGAAAQIVPALGANCIAFRAPPVGAAGPPVDLLPPLSGVADIGPIGYMSGNPILFPFPSRMRQGRFTFEGRTSQFDVDPDNGHHIHGLVATQPWAVERAESSSAGAVLCTSLDLGANADIRRQYDYACRLTVTFTLHEATLTLHSEVCNTGDRTLPMGLGFHPWFPAAFAAGGSRDQAEVQVPGRRIWQLTDELLPTGNVRPVQGRLDLRQPRALAGHAYDHIFTDLVANAPGTLVDWSEATLRNPWAGLEIAVQADASFLQWVLYTPLDRPVVCLEPYTCTGDAANLAARGIESGLITVPPGLTWQSTVRMLVRQL